MGGDHRCTICGSTFTRPQHVARHMRSHTGDRPYKCQHCGDAFARSDLLSRHVNKCHSAEKAAALAAAAAAGLPPPAKGRKRPSISQKSPCDQCTLASLACNSGEPCSKCIAKNTHCTYNQLNTNIQAGLPSLTLSHQPSSSPQHQRSSLESSVSSASPVSAVAPIFPDYGYLPSSTQAHPQPHDLLYPNLTTNSQFTYNPPQDALYLNSYSSFDPASQPLSTYPSQQSGLDPLKYPYLKSGSSDYALPPLPLSQAYGSDIASDSRPQTAGEGGFSSAFGLMSLDDQNVLAGLSQHAPFFNQPLSSAGNQGAIGDRAPPHSSQAGWDNAVRDRVGGLGAGDPALKWRYSLPSLTPYSSDPFASTSSIGPGSAGYDMREFWNTFIRTPSDKSIKLARKASDGLLGSTSEWTSSGSSSQNPGNNVPNSNADPSGRPQNTRKLSRRNSDPNITSNQVINLRTPGDDRTPQQGHYQYGYGNHVGNRPEELRAYEAAVLARTGPMEFKVDPLRMRKGSGTAVDRPFPPKHGAHVERAILPLGSSKNAPFIGPPMSMPPPPLRDTQHQQSTSRGGSSHGHSGSVSEGSYSGSGGSRDSSVSPRVPLGSLRQQHAQPAGSLRVGSAYSTSDASRGSVLGLSFGNAPQQSSHSRRPSAKRNASQTLEQEVQKSLRSERYDQAVPGGGELEASPSIVPRAIASSSRPGTAQSQRSSDAPLAPGNTSIVTSGSGYTSNWRNT